MTYCQTCCQGAASHSNRMFWRGGGARKIWVQPPLSAKSRETRRLRVQHCCTERDFQKREIAIQFPYSRLRCLRNKHNRLPSLRRGSLFDSCVRSWSAPKSLRVVFTNPPTPPPLPFRFSPHAWHSFMASFRRTARHGERRLRAQPARSAKGLMRAGAIEQRANHGRDFERSDPAR